MEGGRGVINSNECILVLAIPWFLLILGAMNTTHTLLERLRQHVAGAIERGEIDAVEEISPVGFPDSVLLHTVTFCSGAVIDIHVAPGETLGKACVRMGRIIRDVRKIAVSGPLHYEPDLTVMSR